MRALTNALLGAALMLAGLPPRVTAADPSESRLAVELAVGSGVQLSNEPEGDQAAPGSMRTARGPIQLDGAARYRPYHDRGLWLGGSARLDLEGDLGFVVTPQAQLELPARRWAIRPGVGLSVALSPRLLAGPQLRLSVRCPLREAFSLLIAADATVFLIGNDLPEKASVLRGTGFVGIELAL